jgi:hypothetical protein
VKGVKHGWHLSVLLSPRNLETKRMDSKYFVASGLTIESMYSKMEPNAQLIGETKAGTSLCINTHYAE